MTNRERFLRTLNHRPVDRLPVLEWATWWDLTVARWKGEGLGEIPEIDGLNADEALRAHLGLDLLMQEWIPFVSSRTPKPAAHGAPIVRSLEDYERILPTLYPADQPDNSADGINQVGGRVKIRSHHLCGFGNTGSSVALGKS